MLAVVGAGHLKGLADALREGRQAPASVREELDVLPQPSKVPWFTLIVAALLLGLFGWGYYEGGVALGGKLVWNWIWITAAGGALGCIAAGGHPLSILASAIASPVTPLIPALSSGMVSAFIEAWLRKPTYQDMLNLRQDTGSASGWWRNRFARVFVNFTLTNVGTSIAAWVALSYGIHSLS